MKRAFTLIELIVVVGIIAMLSAAAMLGLGRQQATSRDARRSSDLNTIQTALESYYQDPTTDKSKMSPNYDSNSSPTDFLLFLKAAGYLSAIPKDPINDGNHNYRYHGNVSGSTITGYILGAIFEIKAPDNCSAATAYSVGGVDCRIDHNF